MALGVAACTESQPGASLFRDPKMPAERRVSDLIRRMRYDEKLALVRGAQALSIPANERLGIPAVRPVTGAMGISAKDAAGKPVEATAFPANIALAATWDPSLAAQVGAVVAQQARALGRGLVLGPLAEIEGSPLSGRAFEAYGEDPWLASGMVAGYVAGVQGEGAIAAAIYTPAPPGNRVAREFGLRPLEAAVTQAGVWAVMTRDGQTPDGLSGAFLDGQLGFRGFMAGPGRDLPALAVDNEARAILRALFASGVFDRQATARRPVETPAQRAVARTAAARGIVLLKNEGNLLPLDPARLRSLAVLGPNAAVNRMAAGSYTVAARYGDTPLAALRAAFGSRLVTAGPSADPAALARGAGAAIVFAGTGVDTEAETRDRDSLGLPPGQDELIEAVAAANPRTIVVLTSGSAVSMSPWIARVPAVLDAWFPGEEGGRAIADILTGAVNPSGRLPLTFPARSGDLPRAGAPPDLCPGYRYFDREGIQPLFPFGFGLSYTRFEYSGLVVLPAEVPPGQLAQVSVTVRNAGAVAGRETVQLYLSATHSARSVPRAPQDLRAFQQVELQPGESKRVDFTLNPDATSYFDEHREEWVQDQAEFEVRVGSSSRDIRATGTLSVTE